MWGVWGLRRIRSGMSFTNLFVKRLWPKKLVYLRRGWERCTMSQEHLSRRNSLLGEGQGNGKKFPIKNYLPHLRIECIATTLSAVLMRKWHLNSRFIVKQPLLPPSAEFWWDKCPKKSLEIYKWRVRMQGKGVYKGGELPN